MSATGYTPISLYYSTTAAAVPLNTNLANGELAINITDGKLYYKDNGGTVRLLASNGTSAPVTTFSAGTTGFTPSSATSGAITLAGTLAPTNGGTGLTTLATGSLTYGAGTSAFSTLAIGTAGQILTVNSGATAPQWSTLSGVAVTTFSGGTTGLTPNTATSGAITLAGTLAIANGGTAQTAFTANYIHYGSFSTSSSLQFDGTNLSVGGAPVASKGVLQVGTIGYTDTGVIAGFASSVAGYNQIILQNTNSGSTASTNFNVSNNNGTTTTNFGEFGINSSGFTGTGSFNQAGYTYLASASTDLAIGTYGANAVHFVVNSGATDALNISSTGLLNVNSSSAGTSLLTITTSTTTSALKTPNIAEVDTISATAATGTINFDITTQSVLFYTSNASANWTVNFRGSSGTSLNTLMQTGESISATFLVTQGATAYYNSAVTIDGTSVTPKWQGGTAPTSGNASSVDCYTYVIQKTGSATYVVLASQTKFA